jgi:hypothetical protein
MAARAKRIAASTSCSAILLLSLAIMGLEICLANANGTPLTLDLILAGILIYLAPFTVPVWFPFLFVSYAPAAAGA